MNALTALLYTVILALLAHFFGLSYAVIGGLAIVIALLIKIEENTQSLNEEYQMRESILGKDKNI